MAFGAIFAHINIVAGDWRKLADFYIRVFGCEPVPPERSLSGDWLEKSTGIDGAEIKGMHLRLPGYGKNGPTLEIFEYNREAKRPETAPNRPGFAHVAFAVDNVDEALEAVKSAGGGAVGEVVTREIQGAGTITFVYATDPEGNIIELQHWKKQNHIDTLDTKIV